MERQFIGDLADFRLTVCDSLSDGLCVFLHRRSFLILAKEKAGSPFRDFLLGGATVRIAII